jgi:hypothetical protein
MAKPTSHSAHSADSPHGRFHFHYAWFAGWRWELWTHGVFVDESLRTFETLAECESDSRMYARAVAA